MVTVRPARPEDAQACVDVLAGSPDFFTRETHDEARTGVANARAGAAGVGAGEATGQAGVAGGQAGAALVEVKTLDASAGYEPYEATRAFWERRGFRQIDCIDPLPGWRPGNPAAIYVAAVRPTANDFSD